MKLGLFPIVKVQKPESLTIFGRSKVHNTICIIPDIYNRQLLVNKLRQMVVWVAGFSTRLRQSGFGG
jgi:hypothetical protein